MKQPKIYLVLSFTGTILSRLVRIYTKDTYCHISIALDENLEEMYSFGRKNPYNPFIGGYVKENINKGTFKRFKNTIAQIYALEVNENQYQIIKEIIQKMNENPHQYKFNVLGLFATVFHYKIERKDYFYCAEFVKYLITSAQINNNLPPLTKPMDFIKIANLELKYQGLLKNYS